MLGECEREWLNNQLTVQAGGEMQLQSVNMNDQPAVQAEEVQLQLDPEKKLMPLPDPKSPRAEQKEAQWRLLSEISCCQGLDGTKKA